MIQAPPQPFVRLGEPCTSNGCVEDAYCEQGTCVAKLNTGSCSDNLDACSATSYCGMDPGAFSFHCHPKGACGDACEGPAECLSGFCDFSNGNAGASDAGIDAVEQGVCMNKVFVTADTCSGIFK